MRTRLLALSLLLATACGSPEPPASGSAEPPGFAIAYRLVDPELRQGARVEPPELVTRDLSAFPSQSGEPARIPRATIDDDSRHVLAGFERGLLAYQMPLAVGAGGRLHAELPAGDAFASADAVVVVSHVRLGGSERWHEPPAVLAPLATQEGRRVVAFEAPAAGAGPAAAAGAAELNAFGLRAPGAHTLYETGPLGIPAGARLALSFGVLAPAAGQGTVRFSLEACEAERCEALLSEVADPATADGRRWNDRMLDLSALAGTTRRLRFRTEHLGGGAFSLPVWGDPVVLAPAAAPDPRPNLILLSIDTLRRDHLDGYGYFRETAPFLREHLAGEGVVFDDFVAEAATTDPSHMTMFTSLPARVHGVTMQLEGLDVPVTTLAESLRGAGYRTAAITEDGPLAHERGFAIGFDAYREHKSTNLMLPAGRVEDTFREARAWLAREQGRPFFLFLHTFQVHAPYAPPEAYRSLFTEPEPAARTPEQRRTIADYDREIRYVDDQLAALVRWSEQRGLGDDTIWIVLSDHGEEFWEHGSLGHGTLPFEEVLGVPLVVRGPGVARGVRRADPLHHLDLMPTLLELAGAAAPPGLQGRSFAVLLRDGAPPPAGPPRPRASASWMLPAPLRPPALALRLGTHKLIRRQDAAGSRDLRFDLAADPHEQRPLPDALPALAAALEAEEGARSAARKALLERAAAARGRPSSPVLLDPEREQTLRALGYIE
jgi:arylsulfatase A-like enzyme